MTTKNELDGNAADVQGVATPKRRARIVKKDTDHVYMATQDQGERFDSVSDERTHKRAAAAMAKDEKAAAIHALESEVLTPPKKNRGRPSKAYLEQQRAYEEALARQQMFLEEAKAALTSTSRDTDAKDAAEEEQTTAVGNDAAEGAADANAMTGKDAVVATSEAVQGTAENVVDDEDDVPEFIKMQRANLNAAKDANDDDAPVADDPVETRVEETPAATKTIAEISMTTAAPEKAAQQDEDKALRKRLAEAFAEGRRFIIIEDIPLVDVDGYTFNIEEAPAHNVPFRRFAEDELVNPQAAAIDAARSLISDSKGQGVGKADSKTAGVRTEVQPQGVRLGEITIETEGVMEVENQGAGYLRSSDYNYMPSPDDVFVSQNQVRSYSLKTGDVVRCVVRAPREGEKYYALKEVISINDCAPHQVRDRIAFEHLTPLFPDEQYKLSKRGEKSPLSCRIVDLFAPIGKGQRALIVAQPKTGKTILMKQIANAIAAHHPESYLIMLLIDERPEEVTDMARTVNAEVIASTFDEPAKRHVRIANIVLEKAKRMVECGKDVVIFLDSITRLARAFNTEAPTSGKILTGGVDANALQKPKRFFGAARNIEGGGSLTIIATALIDTGSKMDEVIFEEFKGTGNMELQLDRGLANKRIFPAVNLVQSSTRREDLLLDELTVNRMFITRNYMADMSPVEAMNFLRKRLETTISNEEFITAIGS